MLFYNNWFDRDKPRRKYSARRYHLSASLAAIGLTIALGAVVLSSTKSFVVPPIGQESVTLAGIMIGLFMVGAALYLVR